VNSSRANYKTPRAEINKRNEKFLERFRLCSSRKI
jgi:hypothetical protein